MMSEHLWNLMPTGIVNVSEGCVWMCVYVHILCLPVFMHYQHIPLLRAPKCHSPFFLITGLFLLPVLYNRTTCIPTSDKDKKRKTCLCNYYDFFLNILSIRFGSEFQLLNICGDCTVTFSTQRKVVVSFSKNQPALLYSEKYSWQNCMLYLNNLLCFFSIVLLKISAGCLDK